jgi:hypothetical protein
VRPTQHPPQAEVNPDFSLTAAGKVGAAAGAAAVVGLLALPVTWVAGAAGVGTAGAGGLLTLAIVQYFTTVLTIDWFGTGIGSRQVKKSLNDRPEGTSLPRSEYRSTWISTVSASRCTSVRCRRNCGSVVWMPKTRTATATTFGLLVADGPPIAGHGSFPTTTPCCSSIPGNCSSSWNRIASAAAGYLCCDRRGWTTPAAGGT